jgi:O-antigen ligase
MTESTPIPNPRSLITLVRLSRWCALATLFFSPWIMQWVIPFAGLDATSVLAEGNRPKLRPADVLAALSVGLYLIGGWPGLRRMWQRQRMWCWSLSGLMLISLLSVGWAVQISLAIVFALHVVLWILFAARVACDDLPPRSIALSLLAGLLINSAVGLLQFSMQRSLGLTLLGELPLDTTTSGMSVIGTDALHLLRVYGLSGHPNVIGGFAVVALVWSLGLIAKSSRRWLPAILGAWLLGWLTLLLAFSRSAWLGIALALGSITRLMLQRRVYRRYAGRAIAVVGMIVISSALLAYAFQPYLVERLTAPQSSTLESVSIDERIDLMQAAVKLIELRPLTGVGIGNFIAGSQKFMAVEPEWVHNVPLLIASELGLPGLAMWLVGLAAMAASLGRSYRLGTLEMWQILAACSIAAMLVIMQFDHYWWTSSQGVYVWAAITGWLMSRLKHTPQPSPLPRATTKIPPLAADPPPAI